MRAIFYWILLTPLLVISQTSPEYPVIENALITANPKYISEFETGVASHNKKFKTDGMFGSRIYQIKNGPNYGKYILIMGPIPWSAFDDRPQFEGQYENWNKQIEPYTLAGREQFYWRFYPEISNFPKDFIIKNLLVDMFDVKRFKLEEAMSLMKKIAQVMKEKYPEEPFGIYTNEFPSFKDGRDLAFVSFYNESSWLNLASDFPTNFDAVFGNGSFEKFLKEWGEVTVGKQTELWNFREDLSGVSGEIKATGN